MDGNEIRIGMFDIVFCDVRHEERDIGLFTAFKEIDILFFLYLGLVNWDDSVYMFDLLESVWRNGYYFLFARLKE